MITFDFGIGISLGALLGFIAREIIGDRLARNRAIEAIRITEFNKAAALFREAFVREVFLLRENITAKLERFNQAWEKYKTNDTDYSQGDRTMSAIKVQGSKDYLDYINNLLCFANPKI